MANVLGLSRNVRWRRLQEFYGERTVSVDLNDNYRSDAGKGITVLLLDYQQFEKILVDKYRTTTEYETSNSGLMAVFIQLI